MSSEIFSEKTPLHWNWNCCYIRNTQILIACDKLARVNKMGSEWKESDFGDIIIHGVN